MESKPSDFGSRYFAIAKPEVWNEKSDIMESKPSDLAINLKVWTPMFNLMDEV